MIPQRPEVIVFPELPDDMADAFDGLKLAVLRHRRDGWREISKADVLTVLGVLCDIAIFDKPEAQNDHAIVH